MNKFVELQFAPDWSSDKSIAYDLDPKALLGVNLSKGKRIFFPRSQCRVDNGVTFISEWILQKKHEELVGEGFADSAVQQALRVLVDWNGRTIEEAGPQDKPALSLSNLATWFTAAAEHLRTPHVEFSFGAGVVRFARKGERAKTPGSIEITNGYQWGDPGRQWYGTVALDGAYVPTRSVNDALVDLVQEFEADPGAFVSKAQKNAGNCCFCSHELTTEASRNAGYGPTCAKNFRLPY